MADNQQTLKETANAIIRQVAKKTALFVVLAVAGAIVLSLNQGAGRRWWFLPGGILAGAALGLINFRWLAMSVERFSVRKDVSPVAAKIIGPVVSFLKLSAIFIVLFVLIKWEVLHILGLVAGLSLCFAAIIWEGLAMLARGREDN